MRRILIVDSDKDSRALIARYARLEGYEATEASDPETGVSLCRQNPFDLMVLEVSSPEGDGFSALQTVRTFSQIPVLVLSPLCSEADRIRGLELGADDYMSKPFSPKELMLRVAAILKRRPLAEEILPQTLRSGGITVDLTARRVFVDGARVRPAGPAHQPPGRGLLPQAAAGYDLGRRAARRYPHPGHPYQANTPRHRPLQRTDYHPAGRGLPV